MYILVAPAQSCVRVCLLHIRKASPMPQSLRSVLIISISKISIPWSQIPKPLLMFVSKCLLKFESPRGWAHFSSLKFRKLTVHELAGTLRPRPPLRLPSLLLFGLHEWPHLPQGFQSARVRYLCAPSSHAGQAVEQRWSTEYLD